jgi:hypothetical protein
LISLTPEEIAKAIPLDSIGQEIKQGDYLTWAMRRESDIWLSFGKVRQIRVRKDLNGNFLFSVLVWVAGKHHTVSGFSWVARKTGINFCTLF